jgi:hypothetical protein
MPPKKNDSGKPSNRIRFIMLDADISDGNLSELTQAITNAIKPSSGHLRPLPPRPPAQQVLNGTTEDVSGTVIEDNELPDEEIELEDASTSKPKPRAKLAVPSYLADLDIKGNGTPFKDYAEEKNPKSQMKRYLLAAQWLRDHGNSPTINTDKVYTLFRTAGWSIGIKDWDANFRGAVKRDLMQRKGPGEYFITPVGENTLQKAED